jgi:hypothetical protein
VARYHPALPPWDHQRRADRYLRGRATAALLMAMRTGKTKVLYDWLGRLELAGDCQDLAVIAPAGVYRTWVDQAEVHLSGDLRRRLLTHIWESGAGVGHRRHLEWFMAQRDRPRLLLVNSEATSTVRQIREVLPEFLRQRRSMAAYDESTQIKGPDSSRALFAVHEVKPAANYRAILSGLPTPRSPLDAYMQFNFLDERILGFGSYQAFRSRYSIVRMLPLGPIVRTQRGIAREEDGTPVRRSIPQVVGYREVPAIAAKIQANSFRVLLEDCYDMPAKMYLYRDVDWHPEQRRVYDDLRQFATAELENMEYVTVQAVVTQMLRLHQVVLGHVVNDERKLREVPELRTESLLDLLEEYDGKAVIWSCYDYTIRKVSEAIAARFAEGGRPARVARFWGGNPKSREEEERMFKEDPACRWMVGTPDAGRFGRDWRVADLCVFYGQRPNLEFRDQGEQRLQGVGVSSSGAALPGFCEAGGSKGYVDMRIRGCTVEEQIIENLRHKRNLSDQITGDQWRRWI